MEQNQPIKLKKQKKATGHGIYLVSTAEQLSAVSGAGPLKKRIAERLNDEELIFTIAGAEFTAFVVKAKVEADNSYSLQAWRSLGSRLKGRLLAENAASASVVNLSDAGKDEVLALVEGIALSNYQFLTYKTGTNAKPSSLKELSVIDDSIAKSDLDQLSAVLTGTFAARDMVNEPVITLTASEWSKRMVGLGKQHGFSVKVLDKEKIKKLKMGGLLGVNKGSVEPPTFNILEWKPANARNKKPIVLVGKGVVYDTGGYNIKTTHMATMKCDMGGGAAVMGTICSLAAGKMPVHVVGLIPATDNRIDGKALVADDVITMMSGTTVEVCNTDAEGRLVLADALHYAKKLKPDLVIDLATLTGAAARITDFHGIAMCSDKAKQKDSLMESGEKVYERIMEFPMWKEFHEAVRSDVADLKNIGGAAGGNITAATFLHAFTDYPWVHLDIAGPAFMAKDADYRLKGGTGVGVRLLYNFIKNTFA